MNELGSFLFFSCLAGASFLDNAHFEFFTPEKQDMNALAALKAEIAKKRKQAGYGGTSSDASSRPAKRWRSNAEIEEQRRQEYYTREKEEAERKREEREILRNAERIHPANAQTETESPNAETATEKIERDVKSRAGESQRKDTTAETEKPRGDPPLAKAEVVARLRGLKEPVTLFGEDEWHRFNRLRELELAREEGTKGQRNVFQKRLREMEAKDAEEDIFSYAGAKLPEVNSKTAASKQNEGANVEASPGTPHCKEDYVYLEMRKYMRLWASEIESMSKEERRTNKGRSLVVTYEETKDWLKPLYKLLRKRKLAKNILDALKSIFDATAEREYIRANSLYLEQLAIGKAPWPMGATMVGIHARAAREKIGEDKIAHVMNDDKTRKYIQGVKRLLTVAQRHFPTDLAKMTL